MMKNKGLIISLIVFLTIVCILLICFMVSVINGKHVLTKMFVSDRQSNKLVVDETYENDFEKININVDAGDVYVKESNDNNVKVLVYGEKENTKVNATDGNLSVAAKEKKCFGFCFNVTKTKVEVYVPTDYKNNIVINSKYGDVFVGSFLNANVNVDLNCGDVLIKKALNAKVNNDYGDIKINNAKDVNVNASYGDIKLGKISNITVKNSYGDIEVLNVLECMNIEAACGNIEIKTVNINKNSYIKNDYGDVEIGSTNDIYIDAKTDLGDVDVNHNNRMSDITLKIKNNCGDIEVDN